MATARIGNVLKFKNPNGSLNGGTLVDLFEKQGYQYAVINTFDNQKVEIPLSQTILIPHQRQNDGKPSQAIIKRTKKEIDYANKELEEYGRNERENSLQAKYNELEKKYNALLDSRNALLFKENKYKELKAKYAELQEKYDKAQSILEKYKEGKLDEIMELKETVDTLSSTILMLSSSDKEGNAFEYLLTRIKNFHQIN